MRRMFCSFFFQPTLESLGSIHVKTFPQLNRDTICSYLERKKEEEKQFRNKVTRTPGRSRGKRRNFLKRLIKVVKS